MRKIRDVLRLAQTDGLTRRQIGAAVGLPYTTVADYLARARQAGLGWPLPEELDDRALEARLFVRPSLGAPGRPAPDWAAVHRELHRKGVTLQLLHLEYKERFPEGYQYSQFAERYRRWRRRVDLVMRQEHRAGEKAFLDYAGPTVPITDAGTGAVWGAPLFVAVLGASSYTYAEASPSQALPDWIGSNIRALEHFGGAPQILVPDNLRAGVTKAHRYEPVVNRTYEEMAAHYGCAVIPARAYKPRDKAKVESGVLVAERWILARLRHHTFFAVEEANAAIWDLLAALNDHPFKKVPGSRRSLFAELDRPALRPLPAQRYEYGEWKTATVNIDYHLEADHHYYSVPYQLVGERIEVRRTAAVIEVFWRGKRVAAHGRSFRRGGFTTLPAHMPDAHRRHLEWTPGRLVAWAAQTGPATASLTQGILAARPHPEQGYRACLGLQRLGRRHSAERLEAACARALAAHAFSYRSVESILKCGLDRQPLPAAPAAVPPRPHANLRGPTYYH
ncbi:MAG TPA: IS21 family transposase [Verrucomicrobiae bacterium]|nr:IS21 family transposase [Verrucomicrobiae bacterium]